MENMSYMIKKLELPARLIDNQKLTNKNKTNLIEDGKCGLIKHLLKCSLRAPVWTKMSLKFEGRPVTALGLSIMK